MTFTKASGLGPEFVLKDLTLTVHLFNVQISVPTEVQPGEGQAPTAIQRLLTHLLRLLERFPNHRFGQRIDTNEESHVTAQTKK